MSLASPSPSTRTSTPPSTSKKKTVGRRSSMPTWSSHKGIASRQAEARGPEDSKETLTLTHIRLQQQQQQAALVAAFNDRLDQHHRSLLRQQACQYESMLIALDEEKEARKVAEVKLAEREGALKGLEAKFEAMESRLHSLLENQRLEIQRHEEEHGLEKRELVAQVDSLKRDNQVMNAKVKEALAQCVDHKSSSDLRLKDAQSSIKRLTEQLKEREMEVENLFEERLEEEATKRALEQQIADITGKNLELNDAILRLNAERDVEKSDAQAKTLEWEASMKTRREDAERLLKEAIHEIEREKLEEFRIAQESWREEMSEVRHQLNAEQLTNSHQKVMSKKVQEQADAAKQVYEASETELKASIKDLKNENKTLQKELLGKQKQALRLEASLKDFESRYEAANSSLTDKQNILQTRNAELKQLSSQLKECSLMSEKYLTSVEALRKANNLIQEHQREREVVEKELENATTVLTQMQARISELEDEVTEYKKHASAMKESFDLTKATDMQKVQTEYSAELEREKKDHKLEIEGLKQELDRCRKDTRQQLLAQEDSLRLEGEGALSRAKAKWQEELNETKTMAEARISALRTEYNSKIADDTGMLAREVESLRNEISMLQTEYKSNLKTFVEKENGQLERLETRHARQLEERRAIFDTLQKRMLDLEGKEKVLTEERDVLAFEAKTLKTKLTDKEDQVSNLVESVTSLKETSDVAERDLIRHTQENSSLVQRLSTTESELEATRKSKEKLDEFVTRLQDDRDEMNSALTASTLRVESLESQMQSSNNDIEKQETIMKNIVEALQYEEEAKIQAIEEGREIHAKLQAAEAEAKEFRSRLRSSDDSHRFTRESLEKAQREIQMLKEKADIYRKENRALLSNYSSMMNVVVDTHNNVHTPVRRASGEQSLLLTPGSVYASPESVLRSQTKNNNSSRSLKGI